MAEEPAGEAEVLRVAIQGGGCGGFEYALGFDSRRRRGDIELECSRRPGGRRSGQRPVPAGATVDFVESLQESGFKIDNPNAVRSCGCGHRFQVEDGEEPRRARAGRCGSGCSH